MQIFPRFTVHTEAQTVFFKILIFLLKINFLYILNCFNTLILKIIFKNKKNILIFFNIKITLKHIHYRTFK
jgi:hypothetical protein